MTVTSFTQLDIFSCLLLNKLKEDLNEKVNKISSIRFKYTIQALLLRQNNIVYKNDVLNDVIVIEYLRKLQLHRT